MNGNTNLQGKDEMTLQSKTALQSKTIRFNLALGSTSVVVILSYILSILTSNGFDTHLLEFLTAIGVDANAALVSSIVGLVTAVIGIYLRINTETRIVSLK